MEKQKTKKQKTETTREEAETEEETTEEQPANEQEDTEDSDIILNLNETQSTAYENGITTQWFAFTAPETGCYSFKSVVTDGSVYAYLYRNEKRASIVMKYISKEEPVSMVYEMEAGEVMYVKACKYGFTPTYNITVTAVPKAEMTVGEDGSYKAVCDDYTIDITIEPGYTTTTVKTVLTANEGKTLDSQYRIGYERLKENVFNSSTHGSFTIFDSDGNSVPGAVNNLVINSEYELRLHLQDADGNPIVSICNESNPIYFKTKYTEESAFLTVDSVTYKSAQIQYEIVDDINMYGYYEPVNGTGNRKDFSVTRKGEVTQTLYGMSPATEYRVWIESVNGDVVAEQKLTTEALSIKADYQITSTAGSITIDTKVSEYDGDKDDLYFYVEYLDEDGEEWTQKVNFSLETNGEKKEGSASCTIEDLLENTVYSITVWVQESAYISTGSVPYAEETREVKTEESSINPDDVILTVSQNTYTPSTMDCTVTIPVQEKNVRVEISCRQKGKTGWSRRNTFSVWAGETSESTDFTELMEGVEYEVQLELLGYGIRKVTTYQFGEPLYTPAVSEDTDTFDSILSYQLASEKVSLAGSSWHVTASYMKKGDSSFKTFVTKSELTADDYKLEIKTGDYCLLVPDTDYTIKWDLYKDEESEECHTLYQEIHTKSGGITVTAEKLGISNYSSTINISARTDNLSNHTLTLCAYIREPGGTYRSTVSTMSSLMKFLGTEEVTSDTLSLNWLKADTTYEVSLVDYYGSHEEYTTFSFTTPKDDRVLKITNVKPHMEYAKITYTLNGDAVENSNNYILVYYREKGCTVWEKELRGKIGQAVSGEFTTLPDDRELSVEVTTYLQSADVTFHLSGAAAEEYSNYILLYYKEKGSDAEFEKIYSYQSSTGTDTERISRFAGKVLKENTTYEYVAGIGESWRTLENAQGGTD